MTNTPEQKFLIPSVSVSDLGWLLDDVNRSFAVNQYCDTPSAKATILYAELLTTKLILQRVINSLRKEEKPDVPSQAIDSP